MQKAPNEQVESLTQKIIGCAIAVHTTLGPGLLESIYRDCLAIEFAAQQLKCERERRVALTYRGQAVTDGLEIDLLVESSVIVEVKSVEKIHPVHLAQVITYLKLTGFPAGLLMNFNAPTLRAGLRRLDHPDLYARKDVKEVEAESRKQGA